MFAICNAITFGLSSRLDPVRTFLTLLSSWRAGPARLTGASPRHGDQGRCGTQRSNPRSGSFTFFHTSSTCMLYLLRFRLCFYYRFRSNARPLFVGEQEQPSATLTVPVLHGTSASHNAPEGHSSTTDANPFGLTDGAR